MTPYHSQNESAIFCILCNVKNGADRHQSAPHRTLPVPNFKHRFLPSNKAHRIFVLSDPPVIPDNTRSNHSARFADFSHKLLVSHIAVVDIQKILFWNIQNRIRIYIVGNQPANPLSICQRILVFSCSLFRTFILYIAINIIYVAKTSGIKVIMFFLRALVSSE